MPSSKKEITLKTANTITTIIITTGEFREEG